MRSLASLYTARYGRGGRGETDPATGVPVFDCWGLVMAAHEALGVALPDFRHDPQQVATVAREFKAQAASGAWERLDTPVAPCVVAMRHDPRAVRCVNHFGVYVGGGRMLHILDKARVHVALVNEQPYAARIAGYWRWNEAAS